MARMKIAPSILAADFTRLGDQVREAEAAGADLLHVDVMDGHFVPNISFGPLVIEAVRGVTDLHLDVHLMVSQPEQMIEASAKAGADGITVHYEATLHVHRALMRIKEFGCKAGIALNPHTPADALVDLIPMLDVINVMTVNPGFGGQAFLSEMMPKVVRLREMAGDEIDIEVDGGIKEETAGAALGKGANVLIVGSYLFNNRHSIEHNIQTLKETLKS